MKIVHIIENLDKGAVENWLVNAFLYSRKINPTLQWTFFCYLGKKGRLDEIVEKNGGIIIYSTYSVRQKFLFLRNLRSILTKGKYDILHVHHDYLSGFYLLSTIGLKFKKRILHIHNTDKLLPVGSPIIQKILLGPLKFLSIYLSDQILGISKNTLNTYIEGMYLAKRKKEVLYYGIEFENFNNEDQFGISLKEELNIS